MYHPILQLCTPIILQKTINRPCFLYLQYMTFRFANRDIRYLNRSYFFLSRHYLSDDLYGAQNRLCYYQRCSWTTLSEYMLMEAARNRTRQLRPRANNSLSGYQTIQSEFKNTPMLHIRVSGLNFFLQDCSTTPNSGYSIMTVIFHLSIFQFDSASPESLAFAFASRGYFCYE